MRSTAYFWTFCIQRLQPFNVTYVFKNFLTYFNSFWTLLTPIRCSLVLTVGKWLCQLHCRRLMDDLYWTVVVLAPVLRRFSTNHPSVGGTYDTFPSDPVLYTYRCIVDPKSRPVVDMHVLGRRLPLLERWKHCVFLVIKMWWKIVAETLVRCSLQKRTYARYWQKCSCW